MTDNSQTALIYSTWYTREYHRDTVMPWLQNNKVDQIILVAMLDYCIPYPDWFCEFNCLVRCIGYYPGPYAVDYWALLLNKYHQPVDYNILFNQTTIDTAYMCLNRKPHWHRKQLYQQLDSLGLLDQGLVSMGGIRFLPNDQVQDSLAPNADPGEYGIGNDLITFGNINNWTRSFLNIVTETVYNINQHGFVSEKIYKPILGCRPFLVYDPDVASTWLTGRGFETFTNDFTDISDLDLTNPFNIPVFLSALCEQPHTYYQKKFVDFRDKIMYNKSHFAEYVQGQQTIIDKGISCQI